MNKRKLFAGLAIIVFIAAGVLVYKSLGQLDQLIERAVETYGSDMLQADVRLDRVSLDIKQGQAMLTGLHVGNPQGYEGEYAMKMGQLKVVLDLASVTSDTILIKEILIQSPDLVYEKKEGLSNFDVLENNIRAYKGEGAGEENEGEKSGSASSPKMIIENLYVKDAKVGVSHKALQARKISLGLPDIHLRDIGKEDDGATPAEVVSQVMAKLKSGIGSALGTIKTGAGKVLEKGKEGLKDVGDALKGLFE